VTVANQLDDAFVRARHGNSGVLIPYLTAGFPDVEGFVDLAVSLLEAGADALEIGIPFSDPLLDGPAIQYAQQMALEAGVTPAMCIQIADQVHARSDRAILFMGAFNPILAYGVERFCREAAGAGVSGLIVPDLPFEEQGDLTDSASQHELHLIQLVAPTSTPKRLRRVCDAATGFVYCISVAGVTGARDSVRESAHPLVERVRACTDVPVAVGFGIAGPAQAAEVVTFADGVIVGSALINLLRDTPATDRTTAACSFVSDLKGALGKAAVI
jgi:tryptophan synthase alpha chain